MVKLHRSISPYFKNSQNGHRIFQLSPGELYIVLLYKGKDGERVLSSFRNVLKEALPENVVPQFAYKGKKIGSFFRLEDRVPHGTSV